MNGRRLQERAQRRAGVIALMLVLTLTGGSGADARTAGKASVRLSGAITGTLSTASCVIPPNPLTARLHKRYVQIVLTKPGTTMQLSIDVWQPGKTSLATTRANAVGFGVQTTARKTSSWFAGWTGTQAPSLSHSGKNVGSGVLTSTAKGHSGSLDALLLPSAGIPGNHAHGPLRLRGSWNGC